MRILYVVPFVVFLVGCTDTHNIKRADGSAVVLERSATAYVSVPMDGRYGQTMYPDSGRTTAFEVTRAFSPLLTKTTQGNVYMNRERALEEARAGDYTYLVHPEILHWEDRATEWSGLPDKIKVQVSVIDVASGEVVDSAVIEGKSKWATLGGDHPQDLLESPLTDYARSLFP
jgi:hypothetical protein